MFMRLKIIIALLLVSSLLFFPDVVISSILDLVHLSYEFLHILFEMLESTLDLVVEHVFSTGLHDTQVIVFYVLMALAALAAYKLWFLVPRFFSYCKCKVVAEKDYCKTQIKDYWSRQSISYKLTLLSALVSVLLGWFLLM